MMPAPDSARRPNVSRIISATSATSPALTDGTVRAILAATSIIVWCLAIVALVTWPALIIALWRWAL